MPEDEHLDHGDRPISLAEILESLKDHPVFFRLRGERRRRRFAHSFHPPDFTPPPLHDRIRDWAE